MNTWSSIQSLLEQNAEAEDPRASIVALREYRFIAAELPPEIRALMQDRAQQVSANLFQRHSILEPVT